MDWESGKRQITEYITKYRYLILVLLAGVMLMLIPEQTKTPELIPVKEENQQNLQMQLEEILGEIAGVGKVRVLLTEASGWDTVYQVDESRSRENLDTVIISNSQREETGLVKQIIPPKYRGAVTNSTRLPKQRTSSIPLFLPIFKLSSIILKQLSSNSSDISANPMYKTVCSSLYDI
jgi:stage III sporulation protein AG